uniref:Cadherin_C domain-containing protein n=1 Tax=Steinernema glaseri TaxID=37863 RepID=A0A1I7Y6Q2_9BILA
MQKQGGNAWSAQLPRRPLRQYFFSPTSGVYPPSDMEEEEKLGNFSYLIPYALIGNLNGTIEQYRSLNLENIFESNPWLFWILLVGLAILVIFLLLMTIYCISKNKKKVITRQSKGITGLYGDGMSDFEFAGSKGITGLYGDGMSDFEFAGRKLLKFIGKKAKHLTNRGGMSPRATHIEDFTGGAYRFPDQDLHYAVPPQTVNSGTADLKFDHLGTDVSQIVGVPMVKVPPSERRPLPEVRLDEFENVDL